MCVYANVQIIWDLVKSFTHTDITSFVDPLCVAEREKRNLSCVAERGQGVE